MPAQRAVAFVDVLGFRAKIFTVPLDKLATDYERAIAQIRALNQPLVPAPGEVHLFPTEAPSDRWCIQYIFSDSIILIALGDDDRNTLKLLVYVWRLTQALLAFGMHPRGAIAFGEMHVNEPQGVFLGKALTEAYLLEQRQDWIGVALDPSIERRYAHLVNAIASPANGQPSFLARHMVPLKRSRPRFLAPALRLLPLLSYERQSLVVINWRWNFVAKAGTRALLPASERRTVRAKVANTIAYLKRIVSSGRLYPTDQARVPVELRTFWVGDEEPPFRHGDDL
jgi:hypothetical protein